MVISSTIMYAVTVVLQDEEFVRALMYGGRNTASRFDNMAQ